MPNKPVYENEHYFVVKTDDPEYVKGEPMNWLVVNKTHGTVEATVGPYPHSVMIAEKFNHDMEALTSTDSVTVNQQQQDKDVLIVGGQYH